MKKLLVITTSLLALLSACTKDITSINTDPKSSVNAPAVSLFLNGEKNLVDNYMSTSVSIAPFRVLAQTWTENTYIYEAIYNLAAYQSPDGWWANLYGVARSVDGKTKSVSVLNNLEQAKKLFVKDVVDPVALKNDLIITDLLEIYTYNMLVNTYGNIPYSEAENPSIPFPKYDDAKAVFNDLLTRVDTCINGLNTSGAAMGDADQIYHGDVTQWKKFAATLKLKLAMYLADTDLATATKKVQEALATGVFQSNADNAVMTYDPSNPRNSNPVWQALVYSGRHDFVPANLLVTTMKGWNDPRLPLYFTKDPNGNYSGGTPGNSNGYGIFSDFSQQMQQPAFPGDIMDYSETEFLLAEAAARGIAVGGTAESHYNNAITASIEFWGGSAADATVYLAQPAVAYATAAGDWRKKIGYQKWIAFYNRNWDAWTEVRRLGYPNLDVVSPPVGARGKLPLRYTYPTTEQSSNAVNWKAAADALPGGQDVVSAKLFWMR